MDWASFGSIVVGRAERGLSCFLMVLSWSRALFARVYLDQTAESFLHGHMSALAAFGGVPRTILTTTSSPIGSIASSVLGSFPPDPHKRVVRDALVEERPRLLPLPEHPAPTDLVRAVVAGKTPYVRFDRSDDSIPHTHVRKALSIVRLRATRAR